MPQESGAWHIGKGRGSGPRHVWRTRIASWACIKSATCARLLSSPTLFSAPSRLLQARSLQSTLRFCKTTPSQQSQDAFYRPLRRDPPCGFRARHHPENALGGKAGSGCPDGACSQERPADGASRPRRRRKAVRASGREMRRLTTTSEEFGECKKIAETVALACATLYVTRLCASLSDLAASPSPGAKSRSPRSCSPRSRSPRSPLSPLRRMLPRRSRRKHAEAPCRPWGPPTPTGRTARRTRPTRRSSQPASLSSSAKKASRRARLKGSVRCPRELQLSALARV